MISIVIALDCEARPLIQHFKLQRCQLFKPFPLYLGDSIKLAVCGIGAANAMLATATLAGIIASDHIAQGSAIPEVAWLNIGIAGHSQHTIGSAYLAHKVSEDLPSHGEKARSYYPVWAGKWPCLSENIVTVSEVTIDYPQQTMVDMEASGFCESAYRFSTLELVHLLKVVSDNKMQSIDLIDKASVSALIEGQMTLIIYLIDSLQQTVRDLQMLAQVPADYHAILSHYTVSVSIQFQLKQLLRRWQLLNSCSILSVVSLEKYQSIKQWMKAATEKVIALPVIFSE